MHPAIRWKLAFALCSVMLRDTPRFARPRTPPKAHLALQRGEPKVPPLKPEPVHA